MAADELKILVAAMAARGSSPAVIASEARRLLAGRDLVWPVRRLLEPPAA
jgi:hypothetical protein